jgi:hypothetical protein
LWRLIQVFSRNIKLDIPAVSEIAASLKALITPVTGAFNLLLECRSLLQQLHAAQAANQEKQMAFEDDILAKIAQQKTVDDGVGVLLGQLTALIKSNPGPDTAKQAQALALLQANTDDVAAALLANTPLAPPPAAPGR